MVSLLLLLLSTVCSVHCSVRTMVPHSMLCIHFHAAAKFTAAGGVVLVCIVREAGPNWLDVTLGVADSGPGIAKESQRHVLRAFTTGDALPQEDTIGGTKVLALVFAWPISLRIP